MSIRFEIALSFAGDHKRAKMREIADLLRQEVGDGKVFFDEWFEAEIAGFDAQIVLHKIYSEQTQLVVACVCGRYGEKPWTQDEWRAILAFERELRDAGTDNLKRKRFLPIRFDDGQLEGLFSTAVVPDVRERSAKQIADLILESLRLSRVSRKELDGAPQVAVATADRSRLPPVRSLPERNWMPERHSLGDKFIGRVAEFWSLYDSLPRDATTVLQGVAVVAGTGGLGKTQLAIEYANRFGCTYTGGVYWVNADRGLTELITRVSAAAGIEIDTRKEETEQIAQLWHDLNARNVPCLVILDNLPEDAALRRWLPTTGRVHTLVTTRRQDLPQAKIRLPFLSVAEGAQLLNSGERQLGQSAELLAERLGGLPLALELAKSYLNRRRDLSVAALIEEMKRQGELGVLKVFATKYGDQLPSGHELDIVSTFQLSWRNASEAAKKILRVMGELAPARVPKALLRLILNLAPQSPFQDELGEGISELETLSLVEFSTSGDPVAHRLILAFARHRNAVDEASPFERCGEVLLQQMGRSNQNPGNDTNRELESMLPHAEFLVSTGRLGPEDFVNLLNFIGGHHRTMGRLTAAREAQLTALTHAKKLLEPEHPGIAISQAYLALVLQDLGQMEEARDLLRQALASGEKSFELGHPEIARRQSNLATVLRNLGELAEARDLLRTALASAESSFEPGHPSIALRQSNLAMVLQDLGEMAEARDLLRKALASDESSFEPGHPTIVISQSNLALVLQDLGELAEARNLLRTALASAESSFEPGHPSIARSQSNLATVLQDLGETEEARELLCKAYAALLERFGPDLPLAKTVKRNLEVCRGSRGMLLGDIRGRESLVPDTNADSLRE